MKIEDLEILDDIIALLEAKDYRVLCTKHKSWRHNGNRPQISVKFVRLTEKEKTLIETDTARSSASEGVRAALEEAIRREKQAGLK